MSLLGIPLDPASLSEVFFLKLPKCPSTPCVSPVIWVISAWCSVILFQLVVSHQAFSGLKDPKTPTLSPVTLPSGRVLCYCAPSTGSTRGSGSPTWPQDWACLHRRPPLLPAPPATASHHLVTLTPSSQLILSPWATSDLSLCSPAKAFWGQPYPLLGA